MAESRSLLCVLFNGTSGSPGIFSVTLFVKLILTHAFAVTGSASGCNRSTDYNGDGVVNSLDYLDCLNNGSGQAAPTVVTDECTGYDYDKNGVINSLDRIKCLQDR